MAKSKVKTKQPGKILQEEIRKLAEENYKNRIKTKEAGDAFSDWMNAEKKLKKTKKELKKN